MTSPVPAAFGPISLRPATRSRSRSPRRRARRYAFRLVLTACLAVAMIVGPVPVHVLQAQDDDATERGVLAVQREKFQRARQRMSRAINALRVGVRTLDQTRLDPQAVVQQVGSDPHALQRWVWQRTTWVPYRGILRGPLGVLQDRYGNHADRALLLARLVQLAGYRARLVRVTLSDADTRDAVQTAIAEPRAGDGSDPSTELDEGEGGGDDDGRAAAGMMRRAMGTSAGEADLMRADRRMKRQQVREDTLMGAVDQIPALRARLEATAPDGAFRADPSLYPIDECMRAYWWVEWAPPADDTEGDLTWTSLDPALTDDARSALRRDAEIIQPDALPDEHLHGIRVRVKVEQVTDGERHVRTALEHTLHPYQLHGVTVRLFQIPLDWPTDIPLDEGQLEQTTARTREALREQTEWLPVLDVDGERIKQKSFYDTGALNDQPVEGALGRSFQGATEQLGGRPGAGGELTAEWVEFVRITPGHDPVTRTRTVFDLLGDDARSAGSVADPEVDERVSERRATRIMQQLLMLNVAAAPPPDFVSLVAANTLLDNVRAMREAFHVAVREDATDLTAAAREMRPGTGGLLALASLRHRWSPHRDRTYLASPQLLVRYEQPDLQDGKLVLHGGTDIVFHRVDVIADTEVDPWRVRMEQGVLDTHLELRLAELRVRDTMTPVATPTAFARADRADWRVLRDPAELAGDDAPALADRARAAIEEDLRAGTTVVVPPAPVAFGERSRTVWWRVDPASGTTLGMTARGGATEVTGYHILAAMVIGKAFAIYSFIGCVEKAGEKDTHEARKSARLGCAICFLIGWALVNVGAMTLGASVTFGIGLDGVGKIVSVLCS